MFNLGLLFSAHYVELCLQFTFHVNSELKDQFYPKEAYSVYMEKIISDILFNFYCVLILPRYGLQCTVHFCLHSRGQASVNLIFKKFKAMILVRSSSALASSL